MVHTQNQILINLKFKGKIGQNKNKNFDFLRIGSNNFD